MEPETKADIESRVEKLLKEAGIREPPLDLRAIADHLMVHTDYYSLDDPSLIQEIEHRVRLGKQRLSNIIGKIALKGLWLPDKAQILVDNSVPEIKKRWTTAHELAHRLLPAHAEMFLGDTAETLDPVYHEMLEQEANFCAGKLLFLGQKFEEDTSSMPYEMASVVSLKKRYGNSHASTLRRYVTAGHNRLMAGVISVPLWEEPELSPSQRCRYFIPSNAFSRALGKITGSELVTKIDRYVRACRGGPAGRTTVNIPDADGYNLPFIAESFYNKYDILTLLVADY